MTLWTLALSLRVNILINDPARTARSGPGRNGPDSKTGWPFVSPLRVCRRSASLFVLRTIVVPSLSLSCFPSPSLVGPLVAVNVFLGCFLARGHVARSGKVLGKTPGIVLVIGKTSQPPAD